jgi:hypothetical protein
MPRASSTARNGALFGTPVNSKAATVLLKTVPLTIGFTAGDEFAVIDQRKPAGQGVLYTPRGWDPSTQYGLLTVLTGNRPFWKTPPHAGADRHRVFGCIAGRGRVLLFGCQYARSKTALCGSGRVGVPTELPGGDPLHHVRHPSDPIWYETHVIVDKPLEPGR